MEEVTGKTLIDWGFAPGRWFVAAVRAAEAARVAGATEAAVRLAAEAHVPPAPFRLRERGALPFHRNIEATDAAEADNVASVEQQMVELMRVPTVRRRLTRLPWWPDHRLVAATDWRYAASVAARRPRPARRLLRCSPPRAHRLAV